MLLEYLDGLILTRRAEDSVSAVGDFGALHDPAIAVVTHSWQPMGKLFVVVKDFLKDVLFRNGVDVQHPSGGDGVNAQAVVPKDEQELKKRIYVFAVVLCE